MSAAPAKVQPRTLFPTLWTSKSTLQRFPRESGFAGGCQRAVKCDVVANTELSLALAFHGEFLVGLHCYASSRRTTPRAS